MNKIIRITETDLHNIIMDSVRQYLFEDENEGNIEPTVAWMKQKYNEFNAIYFDNLLPKCHLKATPMAESGGKFRAGYMKMNHTSGVMIYNGANLYANPKTGGYDHIDKNNIYSIMKPVIAMNSNYSAPIDALENTLIHEMCHYYTWFNEDGSIRIPDKDNDLHGQDFMNAAQMITQQSGGKIQIKKLVDAEEFKTYKASSTFNKGGFKICTAPYNGQTLFWYTKYDLWLQFAFSILRTQEIKVTEDNQVLMLLKRYRYNSTSLRNNNIQVYALDKAPEQLQDAFNNANFVTVNEDNYQEMLGEF